MDNRGVSLSGWMALLAVFACSVLAGDSASYSYYFGGMDWGANFPECYGNRQSPINIVTRDVTDLGPVGNIWVMNPATDTKRISFKNANTLVVSGNFSNIRWQHAPSNQVIYEGVNIHYHAPSEHAINGALGDAEIHFVHKAATTAPDDSQYAVFTLIFKQTAAKKTSNFLTKWGPYGEGETVNFNMNDAIQDILATGRGFYTYTGSLTTPPCTEAVRFFILDTTFDLDDAQLANLQKYYPNNPVFAKGNGNNRALQPLNGREVSHMTFDKFYVRSEYQIRLSARVPQNVVTVFKSLFLSPKWRIIE